MTDKFLGVQLGSHSPFDEGIDMRLENLRAVGRAVRDAETAGL